MRIRMSKWKDDLLHLLLLIFISYFSLSAGYDYDYEDQKDAWGRCPWIRNSLRNGRVRVRSRGRIAKFTCKSGFELVGKKFATCVRGQWNNPIPVCIAKGCPKITAITNGIVTEKYKGAQLTFSCNPGYSLQGDASMFCDGTQWDKSAPRCEAATLQPQKFCDFEDPDLCGWSHDPTHDFDWRRHQFKTPSGHVGTGPSFDHTFGEGKAGYYMYEETSAPRNVNDTSRLFSPVYSSSNTPGCFVFWYHMFGSTIGRLRVYIKPESHVFVELTPVWEKSGDQGNQWLRGNVTVPPLNENFQIVIEGIRGVSYLGDTAIDDVSLLKTDCSSLDSFNTTEGEEASGDSCRGRCHEPDNSTSCGCTDACESDNTCCSDYAKLCAAGSEPPNGEDETVTGKLETDGTPEEKIGTEYTATTPVLSTELVTRSEYPQNVTENNIQQVSTQVPTSVLTTISVSNIASGTNASTETTTILAPTVSIVQVSVSRKTTESLSAETQTTRNSITAEITTVSATPATGAVTVSTKATAATTGSSAMDTTVKIPLTTSPKVITERTIPITSTAGVSNLTLPVSNKTLILSTTSTPKPETTTNPTTFTTAPSFTGTTKITTETVGTTSGLVPTVPTVPASVSTSINTATTSESPTTESVKSTSSKPTIPKTVKPTTSLVTNPQTTRISKTPTTARTIPSTSTTVTMSTSVKATTQVHLRTMRPYRPPPRKTTKTPVLSTTVRSYFRSTRTTKTPTNLVSVFYSEKLQTTTVDALRVDSYHHKSTTVVPQSNSSSVIGASIGVITILCLIGGVIFVFLRRRRQKLDKLHDDSIRFLPDDEVIEYSEASVTNSLFQS